MRSLPKLNLLLFFLAACSSLPGDSGVSLDPRFSAQKKEMIKYQAEMASQKVKKASTYLHDCESASPKTENTLLEVKEFDRDGRITSRIEFYYNGIPKRTLKYFYGPEGDLAFQNLYNAENNVIQTTHFNRIGYDTLTSNFLDNGNVRSTMQKNLRYNGDGFVVEMEEKDNLGRTHTISTLEYSDTLKVKEEMTRIDAETGKWIGTETTRYNSMGEKEHMAMSSTTNDEDEVRMEYDYNKQNKIEGARLFDKDGFLIREKSNTFYGNGNPKQIVDTYMDPGTSQVYQVYEENYLESGVLASYYLKTSTGGITQSGEFTYQGVLLKESIEFNQAQQPAYICTFIEYELYD